MSRPLGLAGRTLRGMSKRSPALTPMPDDFYWEPRCHLDTLPTGLFLDGVQVAALHERVDDGSWFARLSPYAALWSPEVTRNCTSFEAGRRGAEMWALRHEAVLRAKVAEVKERYQRSQHPAVSPSAFRSAAD